MTALTAHAIYWEPNGRTTSARYKTVVDGFFRNVAADSGKTSNAYGVAAQYGDRGGAYARYQDTFGGRIVDTKRLPVGKCPVKAPKGTTTCLSNAQLKAEVERVAAKRPRGLSNVYFVFLPPGVAFCGVFDGSVGHPACSFETPGRQPNCAYHSANLLTSPARIFAVVAYPRAATGCDNGSKPTARGPRPNGDDADVTVSLASHEALEAVTDPYVGLGERSAWWSPDIDEIADPCRFEYGNTQGKGARKYNQTIHGAHYYLQEEWSNRQGGCVQRPPKSGYTVPKAAFTATPSSVPAGTPVAFDASGSSSPRSLFTRYDWSFGDGSTATGAKPSHSYARSGTYTVNLVFTDADGLIAATKRTVTVTGEKSVVVGAGAFHSCRAREGSGLDCWGRNDFGQLGNGTTTCSSCANPDPVSVEGSLSATAITGGVNFTCALLTDATADCWGANGSGQLGSAGPDQTSPTAVGGLANATAISAGAFHACVLADGGQVRCWGDDQYGQLGDGKTVCETCGGQPTPVRAGSITGAKAVAAGAGSYDTCALLASGAVDCWGDNAHGQLGHDAGAFSTTPVAVDGLSDATAVAAGSSHACAVRSGGSVMCWGSNDYGQLGNGSTDPSEAPVAVSDIGNAQAIVAGYQHTCALRAGGALSCWGRDDRGQLGDGKSGAGVKSTKPVTVGPLTSAASRISSGAHHTCAVLSNQSMVCWGRNDVGQLGDGDSTDSPVPVTVGGATQ